MAKREPFEELMHAAQRGYLTRREVVQRGAALGLGLPAIAALAAACGSSASTPASTSAPAATTAASTAASGGAQTQTSTAGATAKAGSSASPTTGASPAAVQGIKGGTLKVATNAEPNTLDEHQNTAGIVLEITGNMFEGLFSYDHQYNPIPMLAAGLDISSDGLTQTLRLRKGVPFHNGQEMKSADVLASLTRWAGLSGVGKKLAASADSITAPDDYTIQFKMKAPFGTTALALAYNTQGCVIYPKSVVDKAGASPITEFIGTGPYKFIEHQPDRLIRFQRFTDYAALPGNPDGYGGHKPAYLDELQFIPVPNEASRVAGMQSGDYHIGLGIGNDPYDTLKSDSSLRVELLQPTNWEFIYINWKSAITGQLKIRQAIQATIDVSPMLAAGRGDQKFWALDPAFMLKSTAWWTDAGKDLYDQKNPTKAKQLLKDANYDGSTLRVLCTQEYPWSYNMAVVMKQQLENVGFKVDLQVTDWATVVDHRQKQDLWEIFITNHGWVPDPTQLDFVGKMGIYPGWYDSPDTMKLADQLAAESDFNKRFSIWQQIQTNIYNEVPGVKTGNSSNISVWSKKVGGYTAQQERGTPYWNVWLTK